MTRTMHVTYCNLNRLVVPLLFNIQLLIIPLHTKSHGRVNTMQSMSTAGMICLQGKYSNTASFDRLKDGWKPCD